MNILYPGLDLCKDSVVVAMAASDGFETLSYGKWGGDQSFYLCPDGPGHHQAPTERQDTSIVRKGYEPSRPWKRGLKDRPDLKIFNQRGHIFLSTMDPSGDVDK